MDIPNNGQCHVHHVCMHVVHMYVTCYKFLLMNESFTILSFLNRKQLSKHLVQRNYYYNSKVHTAIHVL